MSGVNNNSPVGRRYHRVIRDAVKTIPPQLFKAQLVDTSDIIGKRKLAPRTKKAMITQLFEHLENYFIQPGRKLPGRPLQKLVDRQFDAIKKDLKEQAAKIAEEEGGKGVEPLNEDLRTSGTKDVESMVNDASPAKMNIFPTRNPGDIRKSYVRRTPKRIPPQSIPPLATFEVKTENNTNAHFSNQPVTYELKVGGAVPLAPRTTYSTRSRSRSPVKVIPPKHIVISNEQQQFPMEIELAHIPQYSNEISVDDSGQAISETTHHTVNSNVLDLSDLIQTNDTQIDGKIEIASSDLVLCTTMDEMSEVIVMGQNGERYRFVALNDGQVSLVAESSVQ